MRENICERHHDTYYGIHWAKNIWHFVIRPNRHLDLCARQRQQLQHAVIIRLGRTLKESFDVANKSTNLHTEKIIWAIMQTHMCTRRRFNYTKKEWDTQSAWEEVDDYFVYFISYTWWYNFFDIRANHVQNWRNRSLQTKWKNDSHSMTTQKEERNEYKQIQKQKQNPTHNLRYNTMEKSSS